MQVNGKGLVAGAASVVLVIMAVFVWRGPTHPEPRPVLIASSTLAFEETYLGPAEGRVGTLKRACADCHPSGAEDTRLWNKLQRHLGLGREAWSATIQLQAKCATCHLLPDPAGLASDSWVEVLARMARIADIKGVPKLEAIERQEVLHFYFTFSPAELRPLEPDTSSAPAPTQFEMSSLGKPKSTDPTKPDVIGHIEITDLDADGRADVLVCDSQNSLLTWLHQQEDGWREDRLAEVPFPARALVLTNARGDREIIVACQGILQPSDDPLGSVVLLQKTVAGPFAATTLTSGLSRVVDVRPGDFDNDGDRDFVVGAYGYINSGEVGWLEHRGTSFDYHVLLKRPGVIHVPTVDLDGDGRLDFVALFAQEHEQVSAFMNEGAGIFREQILFKAATPAFGSSGIELTDLDQDGDADILFTNGDNMDLANIVPRPYHGVQWLENQGNLRFQWRNIQRIYGAYCATTGDLDGDRDLDIVVTSMFNDWSDPSRASLIWLENDGTQNFKPHSVARNPIYLISAGLADFDNDGKLDILASGMHIFPPFQLERRGRVTLWRQK